MVFNIYIKINFPQKYRINIITICGIILLKLNNGISIISTNMWNFIIIKKFQFKKNKKILVTYNINLNSLPINSHFFDNIGKLFINLN